MIKDAYTIEETTPRLGTKGSTVELTKRQAKYWLLAGVIAAVKPKPAKSRSRKKG
jgi:hypothetical protein